MGLLDGVEVGVGSEGDEMRVQGVVEVGGLGYGGSRWWGFYVPFNRPVAKLWLLHLHFAKYQCVNYPKAGNVMV